MSIWAWLLPVAAYLYGSIPFGFLAAKWLRGVDIRQTGSGNIGATNAARALGFKFFPAIFALDMTKGLAPALAAGRLVGESAYVPAPLVLFAGMAGVLGHVFPLYLRFKGGKAVAAGTGLFVVAAPWAVLICAAIWGLLFAAMRYVSAASIAAALALPVAVAFTHDDPFGSGAWVFGLAAFAGLFITWLHRSNVRRLLAGTEHKIGARKAKPDEDDPGA